MTNAGTTTIQHGTPEFRRTNLALFSAGFATFALLYCVQPLLPIFASDFHVSAAESSLSLSLTTGLLAPGMIIAGMISESRGRKPIMTAALFSASALTVLAAFTADWHAFLILRALSGLAFAGLPAISYAYLGEEVHPTALGLAIGLTIGGNGLGGMLGRLVTGLVTDALSWRVAMAVIGGLGFVAAIAFWRLLPPSRHFVARPTDVKMLMRNFGRHLRDPRLLPLFALGFLFMGAFITTYNYVTYHLIDPPYALRHSAVGFIFVVYVVGIFSSAFIGSRADAAGRSRMIRLMLAVMACGVGLMALRPLALVILGIATVTFGFFGGHSVASSWIGLRATTAKGQASALYLFFYYVGASVAGSFGGTMWDHWRWPGVEVFIAVLLMLALAISTKMNADS